ncbi:MAG: LPS export ABC transporter permease LptF [Methyloprofundus sp.]|nr:LPS export ABC transporter permease LptF [Methyloprofundus sp.]
MLTVIDRLIVKDLLRTFFSVLLVLVVIIVSRDFLKTLKMAANGIISNDVVAHLLGLKILLSSASFMVPSAFVAVLMVIGRMYRDQEMSALASAGVGVLRIYGSVFKAIVPIILLSIWVALFVSPWAKSEVIRIIHQEKQTAGIRGIAAGKFTEYGKGNLIFYTEKILADNKMQDVFVQDKRGEEIGIITSESAELRELDDGLFIVFLNGKRVQGVPGELNYALERFSEYAMRIDAAPGKQRVSIHGVSSEKLFQSDKLDHISELFRRLFTPMGILLLTLMAVPLAQISPRGGVYGNLLSAFLIYFSFSNFQQVNLSWMVKGDISVWLGFSGVYLLAFLMVTVLLVRLYGVPWVVMSLTRKRK